MNKKALGWGVVVVSIALVTVSIYFLINDVVFVITNKKTEARVLSIDSSRGLAFIEYYNIYKSKTFKATIGVNNPSQLTNSNSVEISYFKFFPRTVYLKGKGPKAGMLFLQIFFLIVVIVLFFVGVDIIRNKASYLDNMHW